MGLKKVKPPLLDQQEPSESSQHSPLSQTLPSPPPMLSFTGFRTIFEMEQNCFSTVLDLMENIK